MLSIGEYKLISSLIDITLFIRKFIKSLLLREEGVCYKKKKQTKKKTVALCQLGYSGKKELGIVLCSSEL